MAVSRLAGGGQMTHSPTEQPTINANLALREAMGMAPPSGAEIERLSSARICVVCLHDRRRGQHGRCAACNVYFKTTGNVPDRKVIQRRLDRRADSDGVVG